MESLSWLPDDRGTVSITSTSIKQRVPICSHMSVGSLHCPQNPGFPPHFLRTTHPSEAACHNVCNAVIPAHAHGPMSTRCPTPTLLFLVPPLAFFLAPTPRIRARTGQARVKQASEWPTPPPTLTHTHTHTTPNNTVPVAGGGGWVVVMRLSDANSGHVTTRPELCFIN